MSGSLGRHLAAVLALAITACNSTAPSVSSDTADPFAVRQLPAGVEPLVRPVVEANTRFGLDLYGQLRTTPGNVFFSPFSTSIALAMLQAGAGGGTLAEMNQVLHFADLDELHRAQGAVIASLDRGSNLGGYRLSVADGVWGQSGARIRDAYLDVMRRDYRAGFAQLDFEHAHEDARQTINHWVEEHTQQRIRELFKPGAIDPSTRLVVANAVYFKGQWASQFKAAQTSPAEFSISATERVQVPLMNQRAKFKFAQEDWGSLLELPYAGRDLSMIVLLPAQVDGLAALESQLTGANLDQWLSQLREVEVRVALPRFRLETEYQLNQTLGQMGMATAFTEQADFSHMTEERWSLGVVVHKAFCEVNEEGTEAAAATGGTMVATSMPPSFVADHPFLFLIRDNVTKSLLFLGRVVDPRS